MSTVADVLRAATPARGRELVELHRIVSSPLPLRRRVGVAALSGGTGCSTVAAELALAARRPDAVLAVAAQGPSPTPLPSIDGLVETRTLSRDAWPADVRAWWAAIGDDHRAHDLTITDWGATPADRIRDVAQHSHALCIAAAAERDAVQRAVDVAVTLDAETPVVLAISDVHGTAGPAMHALLPSAPVPAVLVAHDRARLERVAPPRHGRGEHGVRMLRLAAHVVDAVARASRGPVA